MKPKKKALRLAGRIADYEQTVKNILARQEKPDGYKKPGSLNK